MKIKKIIISIFIFFGIVFAYFFFKKEDSSKSDNDLKYQASIRFGWLPSASFCGEIAGMEKFAALHNLNLKCEAGGPGMNSIQLVLTDLNTFGTLAADEVLAANEKGADFVIVGVINYYSPGGFISLSNRNIKTPKDFEGKKIGLLPFGSTTLLYESMLKKNNISKTSITEITISPDLKPFLNGNYDVHPVFVYDETVTLDQRNISYNLIEPKDFGVEFKGPVYFCKRETLENNPEMVDAFVKTMADGWVYAINNPDSAISLLKAFAPEIEIKREKLVLEKAIPYFSAYNNQPINSDYKSWERMLLELKSLNILKTDPNLEKTLYFKFINDYYTDK